MTFVNVFSFRPPESLETIGSMLTHVDGVLAYLPNCLLLQDTLNRAKEWLQEAEDLQVEYSSLNELCILHTRVLSRVYSCF